MDKADRVNRDYFISRSGACKDVALQIAEIIREAGFSTWLQDEDFGRSSFIARMEQGLEGTDRMVALLCSHYQQSKHCRAEYRVVLTPDPENLDNRLIVLRIEECEPKGLLTPIAYVDLVPILEIEDASDRKQQLRAIVRSLIGVEGEQSGKKIVTPFRRMPTIHDPDQICHRDIVALRSFTGRDAELEALKNEFWGEARGNLSHTAALKGLGGVGKTTVAREYAWRERARYAGLWWIRAERRETMLEDIINLGKRFIPAVAGIPDHEAAARIVLEYIDALPGGGKPWLMIYDNVEEPLRIKGMTPRSGNHILITTRWSNWGDEASELPIDVFSSTIAVDYLMARAVGVKKDPEGVRKSAERLAADLGYLPLALAHARSYCGRKKQRFDDYRKNLPKRIREAPRGDTHAAVFATFDLAIEKAQKECPKAEMLMSLIAFMAPERIPLSLITSDVMTDTEREEAETALSDLSLVTLDASTIDDEEERAVSVHRLVQEVARHRLSKSQKENALGIVIKLLAAEHNNRPWIVFPHILEVLHTLSKDGYRDIEARDAADQLARLVIMALKTADENQGGDILPDYLATLLTNFYEVDPLLAPLAILLRDYRESWPRLQDQLLSANNYVLRYAMAETLADACTGETPTMDVSEVVKLVEQPKNLNEFELGGYALAFIYARKPELINKNNLEMLAARQEYPGRSILGDFMLNLAFRDDLELSRNLHELVKSNRFWNPLWDFIKLDVWAIKAAEAIRTGSSAGLTSSDREAMRTYEAFKSNKLAIAKFLRSPALGEELSKLLREYDSLGQDTNRVNNGRAELDKKSEKELGDLMRIFFAHPIWAVAEAAATLLSELIETDPKRIRIVGSLFREKNWRVQFGACEAAFALRHHDRSKLFFDSVRRFHNHWNCKIRGLCAENLTSHILNSGNLKRDQLLRSFRKEIAYWVGYEEDCWVLEHVFRLFHSLDKADVNVTKLLPWRKSPLLKNEPEWFRLDRSAFLRLIEKEKETRAVKRSFFSRLVRASPRGSIKA